MEIHISKSVVCDELAHPDATNFTISIVLLVGILVSYIPQHYKIISRRSAEGLSPLFVLLGTVSGTAAIANILVLPNSREQAGCCSEISPFACVAALLGIAQVGVQWSCFLLIMFLFLVFFSRNNERADIESIPAWKEALAVLIFSMLFFVAVFIACVVTFYRFPSHLQGLANILGLIGAALAAVQYIPQIITTWRLGNVYSLSIPMMCMQTPGSYVWAASLAARYGWAGWSTWGIYCLTGFLQGILLVMGISYWWRDRNTLKGNRLGGETPHSPLQEGERQEHTERSPLLDNSR